MISDWQLEKLCDGLVLAEWTKDYVPLRHLRETGHIDSGGFKDGAPLAFAIPAKGRIPSPENPFPVPSGKREANARSPEIGSWNVFAFDGDHVADFPASLFGEVLAVLVIISMNRCYPLLVRVVLVIQSKSVKGQF